MSRIQAWQSQYHKYLAAGGLLALVWGFQVLKVTWVPLLALLGAGFLISLLAAWLHWKGFRAYGLATWMLRILVPLWSAAGWGSLLVSAFLISNFYMARGPVTRKEFAIISGTVRPGLSGQEEQVRPAFTVEYRGMTKELVFGPRFYKWKDEYRSVILTLQPGFWGVEVIRGKAVTK